MSNILFCLTTEMPQDQTEQHQNSIFIEFGRKLLSNVIQRWVFHFILRVVSSVGLVYRDKKRCSSLFHLDSTAQNSIQAISIVFYTIRVSQLFLSFYGGGGSSRPRRPVACNADSIKEFLIYSATFTALVLSSYARVNLHYARIVLTVFLVFLVRSSRVGNDANLKSSLCKTPCQPNHAEKLSQRKQN